MTARASSTVFASMKKMTPLPSLREYHLPDFPVEVQSHRRANLVRHEVRDPVALDVRLYRKHYQDIGSLRLRRLGNRWNPKQ